MENARATVSVLTTVLPATSQHLAQAWDSIAAQVLPEGWDLEWLVQIDGPGELLTQIPAEDSRIGVARNARSFGPAISRCLALTRASGTILRVLDADDLLPTGQLAREIGVFDAHPDVAWVTSRVEDLLADGSTRGFDGDPPEGPIGRGEIVDYWRSHNFRTSVHPASLPMRTNVCRAAGGWMALPASEDTGLLLTLNQLYTGYFIADCGPRYRKWDLQITSDAQHSDEAASATRFSAISQRLAAIEQLDEH